MEAARRIRSAENKLPRCTQENRKFSLLSAEGRVQRLSPPAAGEKINKMKREDVSTNHTELLSVLSARPTYSPGPGTSLTNPLSYPVSCDSPSALIQPSSQPTAASDTSHLHQYRHRQFPPCQEASTPPVSTLIFTLEASHNVLPLAGAYCAQKSTFRAQGKKKPNT